MVAVALVRERDFQRAVLDYARLHGWLAVHFRPARTSKGYRTPIEGDGVGWPDLVLVRPPRLLFAELKTDRGKLSPAQERWLDVLGQVPGIEVRIWRPRDWERIVETLRKE